MNRLLRGSVGVVIIVGGSMLAQANEVTDWNEMLFRASAVASGNASPLNITRNSALVEAAVFDAVNGIEKQSASGRSPCAARLRHFFCGQMAAAPPGAKRRREGQFAECGQN